MPVAEITSHIRRTPDGVAWIDDTRVKVVEVIADWLAHGSSPEEIHFQYPHLSLAQIHSALAYYYDHRVALDTELACRADYVEAIRAKSAGQPSRQELLARVARR